MLVLERFPRQKIIIGDNAEIVICVLRVDGNAVKIGIEAPPEIPVHREEVYDAICDDE